MNQDEIIMADLLILYAVTANCSSYFKRENMPGAMRFYGDIKTTTIQLFSQQLSSNNPVHTDAGYENTRAEKLLVKPNSELQESCCFDSKLLTKKKF